MKFISICSGIEAASVAWEPLGWEAVAFSEIEPFPSAVLAHHYPDVPNFGDMTKFDTWPEEIFLEADLIVGGPPCQAFSVAGNREGLADDRGNLTLVYVQLINHADLIRKKHGKEPVIAFYENVPGLFSDKTNAYGCLLGALAGEDGALLAPGGKWTDAGCVSGPQRAMAWRLLDAQYFGLAQRRRRVFLVAGAGDGFNPAEILFEREGVRRDFAPSRETGQAVAGTIAARFGDGGQPTGGVGVAHVAPTVTGGPPFSRTGNERVECDALVATTVIGNVEGGAATTLSSREYKGLSCGRDGMTSAAVVYEPIALAIPIHDQATRFAGKRGDKQDGKGNGLGIGEPGAPMNTLTKGDRHAVAHAIPLDLRNAGRDPEKYDAINRQGVGVGEAGDPSHTITSAFVHGVAQSVESTPDTLYNKGIKQGEHDACTQETYAGTLLRTLLQEVGEETFAKWGLGIFNSLQSSEILREKLHGSGFRPATFSRSWVVYCTLSRKENGSCWLLQSLLEAECPRCTSQGWKPSEQYARELGAYLSGLSQPGAQSQRFLQDLWQAAEGFGLLREALSKIQEMGRPFNGQTQPVFSSMQVRRLTCEECEFLQGFPRGYTNIPWRGKPEAPDGPRYKALGNSWAVPNVRWIGARIDQYLKAPKGEVK